MLMGRGEERRFCGVSADDFVCELAHRHHVIEFACRRVCQQLLHPGDEIHVAPTFVVHESVDHLGGAGDDGPLDAVMRRGRCQDARCLRLVVVP